MATADIAPSLARLAMPTLAGVALGLLHFAGLWTTIRRLPTARRPAAMWLASFVIRVSLTATGVVLLAVAGGWTWAAAGLAGLLAARTVIVGWVQRA